MSQLTVVDVRYGYRGGPVAVDLSWDLAGPGVVGLLGPNGAGKTTLIKILATAFEPAAGETLFKGTSLAIRSHLKSYRRQLGYVPQEDALWEGFTSLEAVEYVGWLRQMPAGSIPEAARKALGDVGITDLADRKIRTLSGGQKRRVSIAQSLVNRPSVLLLDEPTGGLDPDQRLQFRALIREVGKDSLVVVSTHLIEDVVATCDRLAVLDAGRVVFEGDLGQLERLGAGSRQVGVSSAEAGYLASLGAAPEPCA